MKKTAWTGFALALGAVALSSSPLQAATVPDAGQILQQQQLLEMPSPIGIPDIGLTPPPIERPGPGNGLKVKVKGFRLTGDVAGLPRTKLRAILAPFLGKSMNFAELKGVAGRLSRYLRGAGYSFANALLPAQEVKGGVVTIVIRLGRIQGNAAGSGFVIQSEGARLKDSRVRRTLARAIFGSDARAAVKRIEVSAPAPIDAAKLHALVKAAEGHHLDFAEVQALATRITRHLHDHGHPGLYALLPPQSLTAGVVHIEVVAAAGRLALASRPQLSAAQFALSAQGFLRMNRIERGMLLVNDLPGVSAHAGLDRGSEPDTTRLGVDVNEGPVVSGNAWVDNFGSRYTGAERLNAQINLNDPTGHGEQATAAVTAAARLLMARFGFSLPLGYEGLRLAANYTDLHYRIGEELSSLRARGSATTTNVALSYPFLRSRRATLTGRLGYTHNRLRDESLGVVTGDKRLDLWTAHLDGTLLDGLGGGGITNYGAAYSIGVLDLSRVPSALSTDRITARTQGNYSKVDYNLARLQRLGGHLALYASLRGQFAGKNLDSSEKFILGGPSGVRAYPLGEAAGDEGWLTNVELRYDLPGESRLGRWQLVGFYDLGGITLHRHTWSGWTGGNPNLPNHYQLAGAGVGLNLTRNGRYTIRGAYAWKLGSNPGAGTNGLDSDGRKDSSRLWLQAMIKF